MTKLRALISVKNKTGIPAAAQRLVNNGFEIVSTGGTAKILRDSGLAVTDVTDITGFPECFDGRVKTLHPKVHGGLLFRSNKPQDVKTAAELGIERIHLVIVDLYHFQETIAKPGITPEEALEEIDIGGPTMIRAAAKSYKDVIVVCDLADLDWVISALETNADLPIESRLDTRQRLLLSQKVFTMMSKYDGAISRYQGEKTGHLTDFLSITDGHKLNYAENHCQDPAFIFSGGGNNPLAMTKFQVMAGNPSYIAMADASQLVFTICLMAQAFRYSERATTPHIAIVGKHGNPCGAGISWTNQTDALNKALKGDSTAVMGGELVTNFTLTDRLGQTVHYAKEANIGRDFWGLDVILAPGISERTIELLGKKEKRRLLINPELENPPFPREEWTYRQLHGGDWLKQRLPKFVLAPNQIVSWTNKPLRDEHIDDLIIAFACCWPATSNTVALAKGGQLIGLGCGQQDRIACVRLCLDRANRAGHDTKGSVFASDAFFPFASSVANDEVSYALLRTQNESLGIQLGQTYSYANRMKLLFDFAKSISRYDRREGPELLAAAGCIGGVVPADGKHLAEVIEFFGQAGMSVAFVAPENRGFAKH